MHCTAVLVAALGLAVESALATTPLASSLTSSWASTQAPRNLIRRGQGWSQARTKGRPDSPSLRGSTEEPSDFVSTASTPSIDAPGRSTRHGYRSNSMQKTFAIQNPLHPVEQSMRALLRQHERLKALPNLNLETLNFLHRNFRYANAIHGLAIQGWMLSSGPDKLKLLDRESDLAHEEESLKLDAHVQPALHGHLTHKALIDGEADFTARLAHLREVHQALRLPIKYRLMKKQSKLAKDDAEIFRKSVVSQLDAMTLSLSRFASNQGKSKRTLLSTVDELTKSKGLSKLWSPTPHHPSPDPGNA